MTSQGYIEVSESTNVQDLQLPEKVPTSLNDGLLIFFPVLVTGLGLAIREGIFYIRETAKARRDLKLEKQRLEMSQQAKLVDNLIDEPELLLQLLTANKIDEIGKNDEQLN